MTTQPNNASYRCPAYEAMRPRWERCRDVRGGTEVLCGTKRATYLPCFEAENPLDWDARARMTFVYDAFAQAVNALVGLALKHGVTLEKDVPERIAAEWENIDGQGTHGDVFAQFVLDDALTDGHAGILTEFPVTPARADFRFDQQQDLGIRAYLVKWTADQIINWRTMILGGREILSLLVLKEPTQEEDGAFAVRSVMRYRVYRQEFKISAETGQLRAAVSYQVFTDEKPGVTGTVLTAGPEGELQGPRFIPFAPVYGGQQEGFLRSKPPLEGLAYSNINHTQVKSERRYSLHVGAIPWRVVTGVNTEDKTPIIVSASNVTRLGPGADAKIVEPTGAANGELLLELQEIKKEMGSQGFAMLQADDTAERTATEAKLDDSRGKSRLWRASRSLEDALEASFGFMADYYRREQGSGIQDTGGSVTIRRDFGDVLAPEHMQILAQARAAGDLTLELWLRILKAASMLPSDVEAKDEAEAVRRELGTEPLGGEGDDPAADPAIAGTIPKPAEAAAVPADLVLNGAQITAAKDIVIAVSAGELHRDTGIGMLEAFFNLSHEQATKVMGQAGTGTPTTPDPNPAVKVEPAPAPVEKDPVAA